MNKNIRIESIITELLKNRGYTNKKETQDFIRPPHPSTLTSKQVGISAVAIKTALARIIKAITDKESIVVYADYDADGITAGTIMWETIHAIGGNIMPYIPHRIEEGYGLSVKGIDAVNELYKPKLIITVDHGITAWEKVAYAKKLGIDVIVTDHHVKPDKLPQCTIVHTTKLSGAGVSWFVAKELFAENSSLPARFATVSARRAGEAGPGLEHEAFQKELLALCAIGTIADMVPLVGPNRAIVKFGLGVVNETNRVGLEALIADAGLVKGAIHTYAVSHMLAPRLNAMGRLEHAMDALRLLCTKQKEKAEFLASKLGHTNRERQQMTTDTVLHARDIVRRSLVFQPADRDRQESGVKKKLIFVAHESYNPGVIGLVAGKLMEEYYRPSIVVAKGDQISKASARSIVGFNIVEAIRSCSDILIDVGGHPMAAGFTVETKHLPILQKRLEEYAGKELKDADLIKKIRIDARIPLELVSEELWQALRDFEPFGFGNPEPVFMTRGVSIVDARIVGAEGKHLKMRIAKSLNNQSIQSAHSIDAIGFNMGKRMDEVTKAKHLDVSYTIDMNVWNGKRNIQIKARDVTLNSR